MLSPTETLGLRGKRRERRDSCEGRIAPENDNREYNSERAATQVRGGDV